MSRTFNTFLTAEQLHAYQKGVMNYRYGDIPCLKSPIDIAIYLRLLSNARPRTIVEIGSGYGGSALMFRDFTRAFGLSTQIVSIDLDPPDLVLDGVTFLRGDVTDLHPTFVEAGLDQLQRPWLVIEDSAHTRDGCLSALNFFADRLSPGEWLVIEDGVLDDLKMGERYDGGPNRAIDEFIQAQPGVFEIGVEYCDMFGVNATYNPNGYLRRLSSKDRPSVVSEAA